MALLACQSSGPKNQSTTQHRGWMMKRDSDTFSGRVAQALSLNSAEGVASITLGCGDNGPYIALTTATGILDYDSDDQVTMQERRDDGLPLSHTWTVSTQHPDLAFWSINNDSATIRQLMSLHKFRSAKCRGYLHGTSDSKTFAVSLGCPRNADATWCWVQGGDFRSRLNSPAIEEIEEGDARFPCTCS